MRVCRRLISLILFVVLMPWGVEAQQDDDCDYMSFKFYAEDKLSAEELLWWLSESVDSLESHTSPSELYRLSSVDYALRRVEYSPRGERRDEESYMVQGVDVGYSTARLLALLGVERSAGGAMYRPKVYGRSTTYNVYDVRSRTRASHRLRADMLGRNYLGSMSYRVNYPVSGDVALKSDWQLSHYVRVNTGRDLYIDGVAGNAVDLALSAQRRLRNDVFFVATLVPWSRRSVRQYSVDEAFRLTNNRHYNPAWGLQDGRVRSSRQNSVLRPEVIGSWWHRLSAWTEMTLTLRGAVERTGRRALAWFDAPTPMPDNYRYLPSYFASDDDQRLVMDAWSYNNLEYTQIDWDKLYEINAIQSDGHAAYAVENRRSNAIIGDLVVGFTSRLRGFDFDYGAVVDLDSRREFKVVDDLLGADHLLDIDYFIRDDATYGTQYRNNLLGDDLLVGRGEHYGYDYRLTRTGLWLYGAARWSYEGFDFDVAANLAYVAVRRCGYFEKELFADFRSLGRSPRAEFYPSSLSAKCEYLLRNHRFNASVLVCGNAPDEESLFLQPDYNNRLVESPKTGVTIASQLGYSYFRRALTLRATMFLTQHLGECDVVRYYDDLAGEYVDAVVSDIARLNLGIELDASVRWSNYLSSEARLLVGSFRYSKDAEVKIYADNDNDLIAKTKSRMKGVHCGYPEVALYSDLSYRRAGWRANISLQYWAQRYVSPSYVRRTERVLSYAASTEERTALESQQRMGDGVMLGVNISKSFRFENSLWLNVQFSVDNLLNASVIYGGYEQHRVRSVSGGYFRTLQPFADKISYAYGRTFRLAVSLGF